MLTPSVKSLVSPCSDCHLHVIVYLRSILNSSLQSITRIIPPVDLDLFDKDIVLAFAKGIKVSEPRKCSGIKSIEDKFLESPIVLQTSRETFTARIRRITDRENQNNPERRAVAIFFQASFCAICKKLTTNDFGSSLKAFFRKELVVIDGKSTPLGLSENPRYKDEFGTVEQLYFRVADERFPNCVERCINSVRNESAERCVMQLAEPISVRRVYFEKGFISLISQLKKNRPSECNTSSTSALLYAPNLFSRFYWSPGARELGAKAKRIYKQHAETLDLQWIQCNARTCALQLLLSSTFDSEKNYIMPRNLTKILLRRETRLSKSRHDEENLRKELAETAGNLCPENVPPCLANLSTSCLCAGAYDMPRRQPDPSSKAFLCSRSCLQENNSNSIMSFTRSCHAAQQAFLQASADDANAVRDDVQVDLQRSSDNAVSIQTPALALDTIDACDNLLTLMRLHRHEKSGQHCEKYLEKEKILSAARAVDVSLVLSSNIQGRLDASSEMTYGSTPDRATKSQPRELKTPECLVTSHLLIQVAKACLDQKRCAILLPPPLSMLPSICILVMTYLEDKNQDHRVLVYCDGSAHSESEVRRYMQTTLGSQHLLNSDIGETRSLLATRTARVIVCRDSTDLGGVDMSFSLVVILKELSRQCSLHMCRSNGRKCLNDLKQGGVFRSALSVLICASPNISDFQEMCSALEVYSKSFEIERVIAYSCSAMDTAPNLLQMATPDVVHIAPPPKIKSALCIFDTAAEQCLRQYWNREKESADDQLFPGLAEMSLKEMHREMRRVMDEIENGRISVEESTLPDLITLNVLKRAAMFMLNDGLGVALEFLHQAAQNCSIEAFRGCIANVILEIQCCHGSTQSDCNDIDESISWKLDIIESLANEEKLRMTTESLKLSATRIQKRFVPLVILDSGTAARNIHALLANSKTLEDSCKDDEMSSEQGSAIYVSFIDQLETAASSFSSSVGLFSTFSHVFHVSTEGFCGKMSELPVALQQLIHAGALKAIEVPLGISHRLRTQHSATNSIFRAFCAKALGPCYGQDPSVACYPVRGEENLLCMSFPQFLKICSLTFQIGNSAPAIRRTNSEAFKGSSGIVLLSEHIDGRSAESVTSFLYKKIRETFSTENAATKAKEIEPINLLVKIDKTSNCSFTRTLFESILSQDYFTNHIQVTLMFSGSASSRTDVNIDCFR